MHFHFMNWQLFEAWGGLDRIHEEVRRNRRIRAACNVTGTFLADIVQDAIVRLYETFQRIVDECPIAEDVCEYLVRKAVNYGIDAARHARNGYHEIGSSKGEDGKRRKGKPIRHNSTNDDHNPSFEARLKAEKPKEWTGNLFANMDSADRVFMRDLYMARPDLFDDATTCLFNKTGRLKSTKAKELRRARVAWDRTGQIPGKQTDWPGPNTTYFEACAIPADAEVLDVADNYVMWTAPDISEKPGGVVEIYLEFYDADIDENGKPTNLRLVAERPLSVELPGGKLVNKFVLDGFRVSPKYALVA